MKIKIGNKNYHTVRVGATIKVPSDYVNDQQFARTAFDSLSIEIGIRLREDGMIEEVVEPIEEERGGGIAYVSSIIVLVEEK